MKITLKLATSLDGKIATRSGESKWITSEDARALGHKLRAQHEAVIIGSETALSDDPLLTARPEEDFPGQPLRLIADTRLRTPLCAQLINSTDKGPVAIATAVSSHSKKAREFMDVGVEILALEAGQSGHISLHHLKETLQARGINSLLIEGGGTLAAGFIRAGLLTHIEWFRAPILIGGDGRAGMGALNFGALKKAPRLTLIETKHIGDNIYESYRLES